MSPSKIETYSEWVKKLEGLPRYGGTSGLERMGRLLESLGHPEKSFLSILVGGTNGKGSVAAFCHSILHQGEYRTGLFTSPHLYDLRERFLLGNRKIREEEFLEAMEEVWPKIQALTEAGDPPSGFEAFTALAFLAFQKSGIQVALLEIGLGGRLDPTTLADPLATVITNIGLDHTSVLGDTKEAICREKLGIVRPGVPLFSCEKEEELQKMMEEKCRKESSPFYLWGRDFHGEVLYTSLKGQCLRITTPFRKYDHLYCPLLGGHQVENLALALSVMDYLAETKGFLLPSIAIEKGAKKTIWPGRLEVIQEDPLILVDSAHNTEGMERLVQSAPSIIAPRDLVVLAGFSYDKPYGRMMEVLGKLSGEFLFTQAHYRPASLELLQKAARRLSIQGEWVESLDEAVEKALKKLSPQKALLVCGGLFLAAEARKKLFSCISSDKAIQ